MNKFEIGDFGKATFKTEKKKFKGGITAYGRIKDIDGKYIMFVDNDGFPYLIKKDNFTFEPEEPNYQIRNEESK